MPSRNQTINMIIVVAISILKASLLNLINWAVHTYTAFFYVIWCHLGVYLRSKKEQGARTHYACTPTQTATPAYYLACSVG